MTYSSFNEIPNKVDVIYIDSLHEADHVEKLIYGYYKKLNNNGYIFIDDTSHLPYLKDKPRNNFYCEINNQETFNRLLEIYSENFKNIDLNFSFKASGLCIIKKINNKKLNFKKNLNSRKFTLKNFVRSIKNKFTS